MVTIHDELLSMDFNLEAIRSDLMKLIDRLHYNVTLEKYAEDDGAAQQGAFGVCDTAVRRVVRTVRNSLDELRVQTTTRNS